MKKLLVVLSLFVSSQAWAESYTCSHPAYLGKKLIIKKIQITGPTADVDGESYQVLQNTQTGLVITRSFANFNTSTKADDVGMFGVIINKKNLDFTRGNILDGDDSNSIAKGSCVKD